MNSSILGLNLALNPLIAVAVFAATVVTDAVYVFLHRSGDLAPAVSRRELELDLVSSLRLLGDQLYRQSGLRRIRRSRLMARRLSVGNLAHSGQSVRALAPGCAVKFRATSALMATAAP